MALFEKAICFEDLYALVISASGPCKVSGTAVQEIVRLFKVPKHARKFGVSLEVVLKMQQTAKSRGFPTRSN
jgi:hypothetical protein